MRVVVAADSVAGLTPRAASDLVAAEFAAQGAQVAVIPLGVSGPALHDALLQAAPGAVVVTPGSAGDVARALRGDATDLVLDLTGDLPETLCADLYAELGGTPAAIEHLAAARRGRSTVALVAADGASSRLTGLEGLAATRGRDRGTDLADVLAADGAAESFLHAHGLADGPGMGAAEGAGALFAALGVEVSEPLGWLAARYGLEATLARCDVVVTGVESLDFHAVGGPVVRFVVEAAGKAMRPAVVVAGRNWVSSRELRLIGVEDAYATLAGPGDEPCTPDELRRVAAGVARTWRW